MDKRIIHKEDEAVKTLCANDPIMRKLVNAVGSIEITLRSDYFKSLVRSIIGQQISVAAASAIYGRLDAMLDHEITVSSIYQLSEAKLREAGLTFRKIEYIKDLANKVYHAEIDLQALASFDNQTIIKQLTSIKGIGKWTAEMFLILSLGRMDILAIDDIGIQRAARWLYETEKSERRNILKEKAKLWKPHYSIASFYLWEAIHLDFVKNYASIDDIEA
ncbi:DNA-3-methyladenine glycosylase family protein [Virgibacillus alimentarius]|uniref:DNA-3-methyladenine glycosylase II n=1 Tax=Virgibacillus alimentarius TaxID=698769 RepID=A0ABS4S997_9BACI|nr:DNA-3-methyladenine glycosylase 2 family protein [Virgibacillus alimentarius]MBP2256972.1 DNA-3-methyladenine glycosylase II [Virgibacillus alimentarius]